MSIGTEDGAGGDVVMVIKDMNGHKRAVFKRLCRNLKEMCVKFNRKN